MEEVETQSVETVETVESVEVDVSDRRAAIEAAAGMSEKTVERDERGRFAGQETPVEAEEPKPARKYPSSWKPDIEPIFRKLEADPELSKVLDEIDRRESDYHKGAEVYKTRAQFADSMEKAISPYMATIQTMGVQPDQAVQALLAADHRLRYGAPHEKAAAMQRIAADYGIDLAELPQQTQVDPMVAATQREMAEMRQKLALLENTYSQQGNAQIYGEIESFAKDHEHFEEVREDMALLLGAGRAENLQDAYTRACKAHPVIGEQLIEHQLKEREAKRKEEATRAAQQARSAAVQVRGAPTAGASNPPVTDRRAMLEAAISSRI